MKQHALPGFTLFETLLYTALVAVIVVALVPIGWNVIQGATRSRVEREVYENARLVSDRIKYEIRNATATASLNGSSSIGLLTRNDADNPTTIELVDGFVRLQRGTADPVNLNSDRTIVSSLSFDNRDDLIIHFSFAFVLESNFPSSGGEVYNAQISIQSDAMTRNRQ